MLSGKVGEVGFQDTNNVTDHPTLQESMTFEMFSGVIHQPLERFEIDFQVYSVKLIVLL